MRFSWSLSLFHLLTLCVGLGVSVFPVCYDEVGCFQTSYPWFSILRPFPGPQSPQKVNTSFIFSHRKDVRGSRMRSWPKLQLPRSYNPKKPTFFLTHGYMTISDEPWFHNLTEAILHRVDGNVFRVDWARGAYTDYCQAAANTRMVAAEIRRVIKALVSVYKADVSKFHLMGHSLGAHAMAYVGKGIPGIGRITALDPAQPGFQGRSKLVRLDKSDAKFVDVIHTDGSPFIGITGFGIMHQVGHVDFFVNGGKFQPNCVSDGQNFKYNSFLDIPAISIKVLFNLITCSHNRAPRYMAAAIKERCIFGFRYKTNRASANFEDFVISKTCDINSCTVMGLETPNYPARGNFAMVTEGTYPFCVVNKEPGRKLGLVF